MTQPPLEEIKIEVGTILYNRWRDEGRHEYDRTKTRDLSRSEYINMYVRHRHAEFKQEKETQPDTRQHYLEFGDQGFTPIKE